MTEQRKAVDKATGKIVRPIARFYLRAGLGYGVFEDAARRAFIAAAIEELQSEGEAPTQDRIAAKTGFTRPEVRRLTKGRKEADSPSHDRRARAARVLDGLWTDPEFLDALKQPIAIPKRGPAPSIVSAVKRYGGAERAEPILRELLKAKAVRQLEDGHFKAVRRTCINVPGDRESIELIADDIGHHLAASLENLSQPEAERHYVRWVQSGDLDPEEAKIAYRRVLDSSKLLIEGSGETLDHERYRKKRGAGPGSARIRVAVQVSRTFEERSSSRGLTGTTAPGPRGRRHKRGAGEVGAD